MKIKADSTKPIKKKTQMLCSLVFEKSNEPLGLGKLNSKIKTIVNQSVKEIEGKIGEMSIIQTYGNIPAQKILIAGIGPKNKINDDILRIVSGNIAQKARSLKISEFSVIIPENFPLDLKLFVTAIIEGITLSMYSLKNTKKKK